MPGKEDRYVPRAAYQHTVRSTQTYTTGHSPERDIVNSLVPKKQLRRPEVPGAAVDESHFCAPHRMGRKLQPVETDPTHPF